LRPPDPSNVSSVITISFAANAALKGPRYINMRG
jgi:hypothetical protein